MLGCIIFWRTCVTRSTQPKDKSSPVFIAQNTYTLRDWRNGLTKTMKIGHISTGWYIDEQCTHRGIHLSFVLNKFKVILGYKDEFEARLRCTRPCFKNKTKFFLCGGIWPLIPGLGRQRQVLCEFKASPDYIVRPIKQERRQRRRRRKRKKHQNNKNNSK